MKIENDAMVVGGLELGKKKKSEKMKLMSNWYFQVDRRTYRRFWNRMNRIWHRLIDVIFL